MLHRFRKEVTVFFLLSRALHLAHVWASGDHRAELVVFEDDVTQSAAETFYQNVILEFCHQVNIVKNPRRWLYPSIIFRSSFVHGSLPVLSWFSGGSVKLQ